MDAGHEAQQRRLARTVVADEAVRAALGDRQRHVAQRPEVFEARATAEAGGDGLLQAAGPLAVKAETLRHVGDDDGGFCGRRVSVGRESGGVFAERRRNSSLTRAEKRRKITQPQSALATDTTKRKPIRAALGAFRS